MIMSLSWCTRWWLKWYLGKDWLLTTSCVMRIFVYYLRFHSKGERTNYNLQNNQQLSLHFRYDSSYEIMNTIICFSNTSYNLQSIIVSKDCGVTYGIRNYNYKIGEVFVFFFKYLFIYTTVIFAFILNSLKAMNTLNCFIFF